MRRAHCSCASHATKRPSGMLRSPLRVAPSASIPTLMVFRDGVLLGSQPGALPAEALDDIISQIRTLDMDAVRQEIADAEAKLAAEKPRIITP